MELYDKNCWKKLYDTAIKVYAKKPWKLFDNNHLMIVKAYHETYYVSVVVADEYGPAILINSKKRVLNYLKTLGYVVHGWDAAYLTASQDYLMCCFVDKGRIPENQMKMIQLSDVDFEEGGWACCMHVTPKRCFKIPDNQEIKAITQIIEGLLRGIEYLEAQQPVTGHSLYISYIPKKESWLVKDLFIWDNPM